MIRWDDFKPPVYSTSSTEPRPGSRPLARRRGTFRFREVTAWALVAALAVAYYAKPESPRTSDVTVTPKLFLDYSLRIGELRAEVRQLRQEFDQLPQTGLSPMRLPDPVAGREVLE